MQKMPQEMPVLARMTIREKLAGTIIMLLTLIALLGGFAISRMDALHREVDQVTAKWLPSLNAVAAMRDAMNQHRQHATVLVMTRDRGQIGGVAAGLPPLLAALQAERDRYEPMISSPAERQTYDAFGEALGVYLSGMEEIARLAATGDRSAVRLFDTQVVPAYQRALTAFAELTAASLAGSSAAAEAADASYKSGLAAVLGLLGIALVLGLGLGYLIHRGIGRDLQAIARPMQRLAEGDLSAEIPTLSVRTEMGGFAQRLQVFKDAMIAKRDADASAGAVAEAERRARQGEALQALVATFETDAAQALEAVTVAVGQLDSMAGSMTTTASRTQEQAGAAAQSAERSSASVQTVASAAEELGASINEVVRQITDAATISRSAAEDARSTDASVTGLAEAASRIGDVVKLISDIAGQTNLLALNATIEAARAGEHGKGFAVVASEVKQLAAQTSSATGQIASQIASMQAETGRAVEAIRSIAAMIGKVDTITVQVAAAAEEQSGATQEIIRAVVGAATGTRELTQITDDLTQGASATGATAAHVGTSTADLSRRATALKHTVDQFLSRVRAV